MRPIHNPRIIFRIGMKCLDFPFFNKWLKSVEPKDLHPAIPPEKITLHRRQFVIERVVLDPVYDLFLSNSILPPPRNHDYVAEPIFREIARNARRPECVFSAQRWNLLIRKRNLLARLNFFGSIIGTFHVRGAQRRQYFPLGFRVFHLIERNLRPSIYPFRPPDAVFVHAKPPIIADEAFAAVRICTPPDIPASGQYVLYKRLTVSLYDGLYFSQQYDAVVAVFLQNRERKTFFRFVEASVPHCRYGPVVFKIFLELRHFQPWIIRI